VEASLRACKELQRVQRNEWPPIGTRANSEKRVGCPTSPQRQSRPIVLPSYCLFRRANNEINNLLLKLC